MGNRRGGTERICSTGERALAVAASIAIGIAYRIPLWILYGGIAAEAILDRRSWQPVRLPVEAGTSEHTPRAAS